MSAPRVPQFLDAPSGQLFCLTVKPAGVARGTIFYVPPFAEEMNKSRRMASMAAERFAQAGWQVILPDLYGTGDSSGQFSQASWASWVLDLQWLYRHYAVSGLPVLWWGLRAGALLSVAATCGQTSTNFLWWQPTPTGKQHLTQFLRLKQASDLDVKAEGSDTKSLRAQLSAGQTIEVAGYELPPEVAMPLDVAVLDVPQIAQANVAWLEVSPMSPPTLLPAGQGVMQALRARGWRIEADAVSGASFWQSTETEEVPALIDASLPILNQWLTP